MSMNAGVSVAGRAWLSMLIAAIVGALLAALLILIATSALSPSPSQSNAPKFVYGSGTTG